MIDCRKKFNNDHSEMAEKLRENAKTWFAIFDNDIPDRKSFTGAINPIITRPTIRVGTCMWIKTSTSITTYIAPVYDYATCVALIIPELALWIDRGNFSKSTSRHMNELIGHYELQCPSMTKFRRLNVQLVDGYRKDEE